MNPLNHVAIIMDGNGRWGLKYKNSRNAGHKKGLKTAETIIKSSIRNEIKFNSVDLSDCYCYAQSIATSTIGTWGPYSRILCFHENVGISFQL